MTKAPTNPWIKIVSSSTLLAMIPTHLACGSKPESKGIPPKVSDLSTENAGENAHALQQKWDALATQLGIGNNQAATAEELTSQLASPSALLVDRARTEDLKTLLTRVAQKHVTDASKTRCAEVVAVQKISTAATPNPQGGDPIALDSANVYAIRYKLQADRNGTAEQNARAGLMVLPTSASANAPLIAYGHGGDSGLAYGELATVFSSLQANHVIVAPSFPGEALCKTGVDAAKRSCDGNGALVEAVGATSAYDGDADELLGLQDCIVRAVAEQNPLSMPLLNDDGTPANVTLNETLAKTLRPIGGNNPTFAKLPATIFVGASRGGLAANLAIAKTGAVLQSYFKDQSTFGTAYQRPSFVSCSASLFAPSALTVGELRLALEYAVKGSYAHTQFPRLPGFKELGNQFAAYRDGTMSTEDAAAMVAARDLTLSGPYYMGALRDWGSISSENSLGDKGTAIYLHGTHDKVVPFTHTRIAFNVLMGVSTHPILTSVAPGVDIVARGVVPGADYLDANGQLKDGLTDHGDVAFLKGLTNVPDDFVSAALSASPFADATLEGQAKQIATALFQGASDAQLTKARALMISGQTRITQEDGAAALDNKGNLVGLGVSEAVGTWLGRECAAAMTPST